MSRAFNIVSVCVNLSNCRSMSVGLLDDTLLRAVWCCSYSALTRSLISEIKKFLHLIQLNLQYLYYIKYFIVGVV